jgi:hypothetical protein
MRRALIGLLFASASVLNAQVQIGGTGVQIGGSGGSTISLTTTGTSGAASLTGTVLNIPQYQCAITLTTTGSSGAATLNSCTLNIPQYAGSGMVWPSGGAGIPNYGGLNAWGTTYNASNPIPANFLSLINLSSGVSGVLAVANGGNGSSSPGITGSGGCSVTGSWPTQAINCSGASNPNMVISTTNYTFPSSNIWVRMNISSNATVTLPANACNTITGWNGLVELTSSSTGTLTITPNGNTYDGITTQLQPGQSTFIQTDGSACHSTLPFSSLPVFSTLVTAATPAISSNLMAVSGGANKTILYQDFPQTLVVPAANCNNTTPGDGWSLPASGAPTVACRTGSHVTGGVLQFAASNTAQFQLDIPGDYDSAGTVFAKIYFTQGANTTASQTIIMQMASGCSSTTDDPAFNAAQAFGTATTSATANTPYFQTIAGVTMTGCTAGGNMNVQISRSGSDTATTSPNVWWVSVTFPRKPTNQAN